MVDKNQSQVEVTFVNHASFILSHDGINLITDPWFTGTAFNHGWELLVNTPEQFHSFEGITHIWFSHEHPDHFSPADLKRIPEERRPEVTILYQETMDRKVIDFCAKLGFSLLELKTGELYSLSPTFSITCAPFTGGDSWAYFRVLDLGILNVNDCILNNLDDCRNLLPFIGKVDVLCTQFGYANWVGNPENLEMRQQAAKEKLGRIKTQSDIFAPKFILPFASFVRFCHEENVYLMDAQNTVLVANDFILAQTKAKPLIMFPGDSLDLPIQGDHSSMEALEKYALVYSDIKNSALKTTPSVSVDVLKDRALDFIEALITKNPTAKSLIQKMNPKIYIWDYNQAYILNGLKGLQEIKENEECCDIKMSSDSLHYFFRFEWGGDTLNVNGRFRQTKYGDIYRFELFTKMRSLNNRGEVYHYQAPSLFAKLKFRFKRMFNK